MHQADTGGYKGRGSRPVVAGKEIVRRKEGQAGKVPEDVELTVRST